MASTIDEESTTKPAATNDEDPLAEERLGYVREVGSQAVWSLSSCKPGLFHIRMTMKSEIKIKISN